MKKLLSLILSFLMILSTLPFVMASADVILPETYGNDADFATLISGKSSVTLDKDYVLTEPVSCSISTLSLNGFTITYNPSAGNESANVITSTSAITVNVDTTDTAYEKENGTFVNYGTGYFFKSSTVTLQGKGSYGDGKTYGDLAVNGNLMPKTNSTYYHYGDFVVTGKTSLNGDTTKFYGNIDTKDFYFERVVELQGYLHTTGNDVNLGKCNPYSGHCQTIYFTGDDTYNGYTIYCEGDATYTFDTEKITLNTNNGRNILKKDMYVGGNLNVTWFGHTELGFSGKVVVDGNVKVTNYKTKRSTNHPTVTDPKNITFANLICEGQSLQLTENYHNADVENKVTVYQSGDAITVTPYAVLENIELVVPEIEGETTEVLETDDAASIRLDEVNGIRFYTSIDVDALAELVDGKEYEVGTLIAPKNISGEYLTVEDDHIKVKYDMSNSLWDGNKVVGTIANIKDTNIAREFIARAYVYVDGVYYYSSAQSVRSLAYVANEFVKDTDNFAKLDTDIQALVETWASKFNG